MAVFKAKGQWIEWHRHLVISRYHRARAARRLTPTRAAAPASLCSTVAGAIPSSQARFSRLGAIDRRRYSIESAPRLSSRSNPGRKGRLGAAHPSRREIRPPRSSRTERRGRTRIASSGGRGKHSDRIAAISCRHDRASCRPPSRGERVGEVEGAAKRS